MSELTKKALAVFKKKITFKKRTIKNNNIKYNRRMWSKQANILLPF